MALDHHPVQNSEVYVLNSSHAPSMPPPSPPSLATPCEELSSSLTDLCSITPPEPQESCSKFNSRLTNAVHVLSTEATSLSRLTMLYETDPIARRGFNSAVETITRYGGRKGKVLVCGVGKSGHIGVKLVATFLSLKIPAVFLHPTEALHGDLGAVNDHDTILFISNSGKTGELLALLPHFDTSLPTIIMTSHTHPSNCEIIKQRPGTILLPAPIHISETDAFGVNAPTISTTMALALGDALAIAVSRELHSNLASVFLKNHPGGAIGAAIQAPKKLSDMAISLIDMPEVSSTFTFSRVLLSAYQSTTGWARQGSDVVVSPRRIKKLRATDMEEPAVCVRGLMVPRCEWIPVSADMDVSEAVEWIERTRRSLGDARFGDDAILVTMDEDEVCGVVEIGEVLSS
ncbi:Arabinose 5-phosphate isomerase [Lachnellula hyalina]|uniref:Arabinose 5-phosphate isomerase n=1 Tax=Lachnellula hyalina TaxID=1316788 RepID=A0A8H8U0R4_9HELO|nr:Arabinose 5-phosphate isomerase [Lachnellula hyalina]TVY29217.1 Arabinose 5-phosphate isomerase [Lachnellula hyalina]